MTSPGCIFLRQVKVANNKHSGNEHTHRHSFARASRVADGKWPEKAGCGNGDNEEHPSPLKWWMCACCFLSSNSCLGLITTRTCPSSSTELKQLSQWFGSPPCSYPPANKDQQQKCAANDHLCTEYAHVPWVSIGRCWTVQGPPHFCLGTSLGSFGGFIPILCRNPYFWGLDLISIQASSNMALSMAYP